MVSKKERKQAKRKKKLQQRKDKENAWRHSFKLHQYPYIYQCSQCKSRFEEPFELSLEEERLEKELFGVRSGLPLFYECDFCHDDTIKPIGYDGPPGFIINSDAQLGIPPDSPLYG